MTIPPKTDDIRCYVLHYLNCSERISNQSFEPLKFLYLTESSASSLMQCYLGLHEKFVSSNNLSLDAKDQYHEKEKDFLRSHIERILINNESNLLKKSQIEWIKKDRTQLYTLMMEVERYLTENSLRKEADRKIKSITKAQIHY